MSDSLNKLSQFLQELKRRITAVIPVVVKKTESIKTISILFVVALSLASGNLEAQTYRILPLGNSITEGVHSGGPTESERISYRKELYDQLINGGYSFDFVGHNYSGYDLLSDANHGGIPGARAQHVVRLLQDGYDERWEEQITPNGEPYLDVYPTDIILLHIGTNDITHGEGSGASDLENILDEIDAWETSSGTHVAVFVARIIQRTDSPSNNMTTLQLNDNVASMVEGRNDPSIIMVNMETGAGIDYITEMLADGIHPTQSAYDKMGQQWYTSLDAYLRAIPDPPGGLSLRGETTNSIRLSWSDNSNNETGFEIERSITSVSGSFTLIHTAGAGTTSYTDGHLNENTQYYYRIRAINTTGPSLYTSIESTYPISTQLAAPTGLSAVSMDVGTINLIWSDNSDDETAFKIERSLSPGTGYEEIHTTTANITNYTDSGLADDVEYFYRVRATNGIVYSMYSNEASSTTQSVSATQGVILSDSPFSFYSNPNSGKIILSIGRGDHNVITSYVRLSDFSGQVHFLKEIGLADGMQKTVFEIQLPPSLANGFYSLTLITGTRSVSEKFVLMR